MPYENSIVRMNEVLEEMGVTHTAVPMFKLPDRLRVVAHMICGQAFVCMTEIHDREEADKAFEIASIECLRVLREKERQELYNNFYHQTWEAFEEASPWGLELTKMLWTAAQRMDPATIHLEMIEALHEHLADMRGRRTS